jgi:hypothetical protein
MPIEHNDDHSVEDKEGHSVVYSNGDDEVKELYRRYRASEDTATWKYVTDVLACAKRLMPHPTSFFFFQAHNRRLHGQSFEFLKEVMQYVETGRCTLQPLSAFELIEDHPDRDSSVSASRKVLALNVPSTHLTPLATWVSHPGGLTHLVETLYIFFGPARVEKTVQLPIRKLSERKLTKGWMTVVK